jgi:hypothetical protein
LNTKQAILEATKESLGFKSIKKKTWMRMWNEDLKQITDGKCIYKVRTHNNALSIRNRKLTSRIQRVEAVPPHAMEVLRGRGGIASTHA